MLRKNILNGSPYESHFKCKCLSLLLLRVMGMLYEALDMFARKFVGILHKR